MAHFPRKLALLALAAAAACSDTAPSAPPPLDRFYYPTGLAVRKLASGHAQLAVASSNFDLLYDAATGGTVISVDVDATLARGAGSARGTPIPLADPRAVRLGSFSGELAIADPATCPGFSGTPQVLVASRSDGALYRFSLDDTGVSCPGANGCRTPLETAIDDPYGVTLACVDRTATSPAQLFAYVGYLRAQASAGVLTRVDLAATPSAATHVDVSAGTASSAAYDAATRRLYVTTRFIGVGSSPLRWLDLAVPGTPATIIDLDPQIRGNEMRGIALSTPAADAAHPRRAYLPLRLYDFDLAASIGRPPNDVGAALAVLDVSDSPGVPASVKLLRLVPLPRGASEVRAIPRTGKRDLVAVTSTDDGALTLYDDESGTVARVFGRCGARDLGPEAPCRPGVDDGKPALGQQPFGLAVEQDYTPPGVTAQLARLYVGSFDRSWVNVIEIDPANPGATTVAAAGAPGGAYTLRWDRIGLERP